MVFDIPVSWIIVYRMSNARSFEEVADMTMIEHAIWMDYYERFGFAEQWETNALLAKLMANNLNYMPMSKTPPPEKQAKPKQFWYKLGIDQFEELDETPEQIAKRLRNKMRASI